jgi:8-oxo-dGTP diphosphatase
MIENTDIKFSAGVLMLVFNEDFSKILLLKRNEAKRKKYGFDWGNPEGMLEFREFSIDGAIRETWEETGLEIKKEKTKHIATLEHPRWGEKFHSFHFVYGTSISENEKVTINPESDEYRWFNIEDLPDKMIDEKEDIIKWKKILENQIWKMQSN